VILLGIAGLTLSRIIIWRLSDWRAGRAGRTNDRKLVSNLAIVDGNRLPFDRLTDRVLLFNEPAREQLSRLVNTYRLAAYPAPPERFWSRGRTCTAGYLCGRARGAYIRSGNCGRSWNLLLSSTANRRIMGLQVLRGFGCGSLAVSVFPLRCAVPPQHPRIRTRCLSDV